MAEFYHHGVKGQRWGVRRYRNADGSLTPAGKKRAAKLIRKKDYKELDEEYNKLPSMKNLKRANSNLEKAELKFMEKHDSKAFYNYDAYAKAADKFIKSAKYDKLYKAQRDAAMKFEKDVDKFLDTYLGKYGDREFSYKPSPIDSKRKTTARTRAKAYARNYY